MPIGNVSAAIATQKEYVVPKIEKLALAGSVLWKHFKLNTKIKAISNRPARIPMQPLTANAFRVGNFDGGDLGLGTAPQTIPATVSCVSFVQATQWTAQAEYTTDSDEKAVEDYVSFLESQRMETISGYMDSLLQTDGSNTLDTIVSVSGTVVTVNNPNAFQDGQVVDIYSNLLDQSGVFRGSATILSVDAILVQLTFTAALPSGTTTGDRLLVNGSPGVSNSGLNGLRALNVSGNTGTYLNVQRSAYPGKFSVPNFNAPGTITPSLVRALEALMEISLGVQKAEDANIMPHCNVDMMAAWENNALQVQRVDYVAAGNESMDMLKKKRTRTIAGRPAIVNERAKPGYIDWLALEHWFQVQSKSLSMYDVNGQTTFPTYGASGGISASMISYLVIMLQIASVQPRLNAYLSGVTVPKYYFGK